METEKERILGLLRKGVIKEGEAIELLERLGDSSKDAKASVQKDANGYDSQEIDAATGIRNAFSQVGDGLRSVFGSVSKGVNDNVDFSNGWPKLRTTKKLIDKTFTEEISKINLDFVAGKLIIERGLEAKAEIEYKVYGTVDGDIDQYLRSHSQLEVVDGELIARAGRRVGVDFLLTLPESDYEEVVVDFSNGDVNLSDLKTQELSVIQQNGKQNLSNLTVTKMETSLKNGEIKFDGSFESGNVGLVNGNIRLTQRNMQARNLHVKNVNGDVKLAVPRDLGLAGYVRTVFGGYKTRLEMGTPFEAGRNGGSLVRSGEGTLTFELETKSGTIWIKDNESASEHEQNERFEETEDAE